LTLAEDGMTMICVTHEMGFARQVATAWVFMDRGEIVEQGEPIEMFERPKTDRLRLFLSRSSGGIEGRVTPEEFRRLGTA
jgi:general L-amino acid transport system ATP-binding protein